MPRHAPLVLVKEERILLSDRMNEAKLGGRAEAFMTIGFHRRA